MVPLITFGIANDRTLEISDQEAGQFAAWLHDETARTSDPAFNSLGARIDSAIQAAQGRVISIFSEEERGRAFVVLQRRREEINENSRLDLFRKALQAERTARIARDSELDESS